MVDLVDQVDFVLVASESEALLAEQNFIKQYTPRFNIRLRDDKSYPYIAISMDEDFPRVYFTRERHRRNRLYFGPYSNAKRVRGTLDLLQKVFAVPLLPRARAGPAQRLAVPGPLHQALRGALRGPRAKEEYRAAIDGVMDFLSGRYRADRARPRAAHEGGRRRPGVRAGRAGAQPPAGRSQPARAPARRQRGRSARSTRSPSRSTAPTPTPRSSRSATASCRTASPSIWPTRPADELGEVAEEFLLQYYGTRWRSPPQVIVQRAGRRPRRARRGARRSGAARASRSAPPSAATSAASSSSPSATPASRSTRIA